MQQGIPIQLEVLDHPRLTMKQSNLLARIRMFRGAQYRVFRRDLAQVQRLLELAFVKPVLKDGELTAVEIV